MDNESDGKIGIVLPGRPTYFVNPEVVPVGLVSHVEEIHERETVFAQAVAALREAGWMVVGPGEHVPGYPRCVCTTSQPFSSSDWPHKDGQCVLGAGTIDGLCDHCRSRHMPQATFTTIYTPMPGQAPSSDIMWCVSAITSNPKRRHITYQLGPSLPGDAPRPLRAVCGLNNLRYVWPQESVGMSTCHVCNSITKRLGTS